MNKLIITSSEFSGEVAAIYGDDYRFISVDFSSATMEDKPLQWIKANLPVMLYAELAQEWAALKLQLVIEGYEVPFDMFWDRYDQKVNKGRCLTIWNRMKPQVRNQAFAGIVRYERYLASLQWKRNKADPETYLQKKYWENDWK